ncbi:hypothetical protein P7K49_036856 [Saguinus oedipus]|uniref:Uncharacterized protein n=1 Tax=Saguinus oedipus TaxID=9490 RepID=A0ABQ9TLD3_SAGOE|nr:hypothetical protein P7K49_036856 [Saguinus oedipus]
MVEGRVSKFLEKLGFSGGGLEYQALEKDEEEALVSPGDPAPGTWPDPASPPSSPPRPYPGPRVRAANRHPAPVPWLWKEAALIPFLFLGFLEAKAEAGLEGDPTNCSLASQTELLA